MSEDLWAKIQWLEKELQEGEPEIGSLPEVAEEAELGPGYNYAVDFDRIMFADEDYRPREDEPKRRGRKKKPEKNRNIRGLVFLAILELFGIFAIIGWWIRWLI